MVAETSRKKDTQGLTRDQGFNRGSAGRREPSANGQGMFSGPDSLSLTDAAHVDAAQVATSAQVTDPYWGHPDRGPRAYPHGRVAGSDREKGAPACTIRFVPACLPILDHRGTVLLH